MSEKKIRFAAVGDITLGDHPMCVGFGAYSRFKVREPSYPFQQVENELKKADLLFGNLECSFMKEAPENSYASRQMYANPKHLDGIANAGFKVLNIANNHTMQHGKGPFLETVGLLKKKEILCCGISAGNHLSGRPALFSAEGIRIGFLGYSMRPRQYFTDIPLYAEGIPDSMESDVKSLRKETDVVVVSVHWGDEFIPQPSPEEITTARRLINAGANLIIGHHPHVLRGIETYKGGVIAYSLGNFVCDMVWERRLRESLIFKCSISKSGVSDVELIPIYINENFQPEILSGKEADSLLSRMNDLSLELSSLKTKDEDIRKYLAEADEFQRLYRSKCHRFFLSNIYKFPPGILFQQFSTYLGNRLDEIKVSLKSKR